MTVSPMQTAFDVDYTSQAAKQAAAEEIAGIQADSARKLAAAYDRGVALAEVCDCYPRKGGGFEVHHRMPCTASRNATCC